MSMEGHVWNRNSSSWRQIMDSATISWNFGTNHEASLGIVPGSISNTEAATMAQATIKGRASGAGTGAPTDLSNTQVATILPDSSTSQRGVIEHATDAEIRAATTGNTAVTAAGVESASALVTLTESSGAVAVDWDSFINGTVTVDEASVISNPSNGQPGTWRTILVKGNNSTDRTITFGSNFGGDPPTITDCDDTKWYLLMVFCVTTSHFIVSAIDGSAP